MRCRRSGGGRGLQQWQANQTAEGHARPRERATRANGGGRSYSPVLAQGGQASTGLAAQKCDPGTACGPARRLYTFPATPGRPMGVLPQAKPRLSTMSHVLGMHRLQARTRALLPGAHPSGGPRPGPRLPMQPARNGGMAGQRDAPRGMASHAGRTPRHSGPGHGANGRGHHPCPPLPTTFPGERR